MALEHNNKGFRAVVSQKLARAWYKGPASRRDDLILLDGRRAVLYEPTTDAGRVGLDLAKIRTPDAAVQFASKYGLLTVGSEGLADEPPPNELSQPYADFERAAIKLHEIMRVIVDVRVAQGERADNREVSTTSKAEAMGRMRARFGPRDPNAIVILRTAKGIQRLRAIDSPLMRPEDFREMSDRAVLIKASDWAAWGLSDGLAQNDAHPYVFDRACMFPEDGALRPGELRIGILPENLLGFCYLSVAQALATERLALCEQCKFAFVVDDGRQLFCTKTCASYARFQRFKNKSRTPKHEKKGSAHGKSTRTR